MLQSTARGGSVSADLPPVAGRTAPVRFQARAMVPRRGSSGLRAGARGSSGGGASVAVSLADRRRSTVARLRSRPSRRSGRGGRRVGADLRDARRRRAPPCATPAMGLAPARPPGRSCGGTGPPATDKAERRFGELLCPVGDRAGGGGADRGRRPRAARRPAGGRAGIDRERWAGLPGRGLDVPRPGTRPARYSIVSSSIIPCTAWGGPPARSEMKQTAA